MYSYLKGTVTEIHPNSITIDIGGVGYSVLSPNPYEFKLETIDKAFIYHHIREDINALYGFKTKDAKSLFIKLLSVKGIGPKMAQKIVTDLKDKIDKVDETSQISTFLNNTNQSEALSALIALGFDRNKSRKTISKIIETEGAEMSVEQLIKLALKQL